MCCSSVFAVNEWLLALIGLNIQQPCYMKYRLNSLNKAHKRVETCFIMTSTYVHPDCTLSLMHQYSQVVDLIIKIIPHRRSEQPMNDCRRLLKNVSSNLDNTWTNQVWIKAGDMKMTFNWHFIFANFLTKIESERGIWVRNTWIFSTPPSMRKITRLFSFSLEIM